MSEFFRFPHTPHLTWLGDGEPRDDKILSPFEAEALLQDAVVVEEKLDGANVGISVTLSGELKVQNRGQYLDLPFTGQFSRLAGWLGQYQQSLTSTLSRNEVLFGEWCVAKHSLEYDTLPDWFLVFDVFDRRAAKFWSADRRNQLVRETGLTTVPEVARGKFTLASLKKLLDTQPSRYRSGPMEGLVIRRDVGEFCESRAKLVRAEFNQSIGEHWRSRHIEWNSLVATKIEPS